MTDAIESPQVDLDNCAKEPIHILGRVQSHGILLALREPTLTIAQVSSNLAPMLGRESASLLNQPIAELIGDEQTAALRTASSANVAGFCPVRCRRALF